MRSPLHPGNLPFYLLWAILLVAAISRFYGLDRLSLWEDELWVVMDSTQGSLWQMLQTVYYQDNHPPGLYLMSRYSQYILGTSDAAIRLPFAIAGVLLVGLTWKVGSRFFSGEAGLVAAAVVAGSYQAIYYSQEARANILVALFALAAFYFFYTVLEEEKKQRSSYAGFWLSAATVAYLHYAGLVFVLSLGIIFCALWLLDRKKYPIGAGVWLFVPVILLYAPWLPGTWYDLQNSPPESWQHAPDAKTLARTFTFLFGRDGLRINLSYAVFWLTLAAIAVIPLLGRQHQKRKSLVVLAMMWMAALLPLAMFFIKSLLSQPVYNERHFIYCIPFLALAGGFWMAWLLDCCPARYRAGALVVCISIILAYQGITNKNRSLYRLGFFKAEYRQSVEFVRQDHQFWQQEKPAILANTRFFDHYLALPGLEKPASSFHYEAHRSAEEAVAYIEANNAREFYLLEAGVLDAMTPQNQALSARFQPLCRKQFDRVQVIRYGVRSAQPVDLMTLPVCEARPQNPG